jgi:hypothetical protein
MQILFWTDYLLLPLFVFLIYYAGKRVADKRYLNTPVHQYFLPALMFRILGAFLTALMYQYYYGYGDTTYYYLVSSDIVRMFWKDPATALEMCFVSYEDLSLNAKFNLSMHKLYADPSTGLVMRMGGLLGIFCFGSFFGISFMMTVFAFVGCWLLFRVFYDMYPHLHKELAFAILFLPSMCFWGTGLMKEPLTLGGQGLMVYGLYYLLIKANKPLLGICCTLLGGILIFYIKIYVILALAPAMTLWVFFQYKEKIRSVTLRKFATPIFLIVGALGGALVLQRLGQVAEGYSLENIMQQAHKTQWWLSVSTEKDGGTGYTFGDFSPTPLGMLKLFPQAVNVTLFRPYIWEARKVIVLPSAAEAIVTLSLTLYVLYIVGLGRAFRIIFSNPSVLFCLTFAIIFAFAVGFSTMNFGSLARYKIPCLPFYFTAVILVWDARLKPAVLGKKSQQKKPKLAKINPHQPIIAQQKNNQ